MPENFDRLSPKTYPPDIANVFFAKKKKISNFPLTLQWSSFFSTQNLIKFFIHISPHSNRSKFSVLLIELSTGFSISPLKSPLKKIIFSKINFKNLSKSFFWQSYYRGVFFCQKNFTKDHSKIKFQYFTYF